MEEDKRAICDALCETLRLTRECSDLDTLAYVHCAAGDEYVLTVWGADKRIKKRVCVTADSGVAMIRDILRHI